MKKKIVVLAVHILLLTSFFVFFAPPSSSDRTNIIWDVTIHLTDQDGKYDYVVFGEAPDANDGPPADNYDLVKPPAPPMPPYLRAWFNDNLPVPYNLLWKDYRKYPGGAKVWNLTVQWTPQDYITPTNITMSWNTSAINTSQYDFVNLCAQNETILANMQLESSYTFTCTANTFHSFKIICSLYNQPPYVPSSPNPINSAIGVNVNTVLSWVGGDPDVSNIVTYDVYFGTSTPPPVVVNNQSLLVFNPGMMQYSTTYYWRIIAWDNKSASTQGPLWQFTTEATSTPGVPNGGGNGENIPPYANASRSERQGFVAENLLFDGSLSSDPDGYISRWIWDFGDGATGNGEKTTHAYQTVGVYTVTLKVFDNQNASASDTITVKITTANIPPTPPVIDGATQGTRNTPYTYTLYSTDADDDFLRYTINWGDSTQNTSEFLPNATAWSVDHIWSTAGKYRITAWATDGITTSPETTVTVFIDVHFIGSLGFLYDTTGDMIYDSLYVNETSMITPVQRLENGSYLLDTNDDGTWDYSYDPNTGSLTLLTTTETSPVEQWLFVLIIVIAFVIIAAIVYFYKKGYF